MSGPRRRASLLWALALVASTVAVIVGSSPDRARAAVSGCILGCGTTSSSSSSSTSSTSSSTSTSSTTVAAPPPTNPSPSDTATFVPCGSISGPCAQEPLKIQVTYPAGPPAAVELDWTAQGRAAAAPDPDSSSVTLMWADGSDCGTGTSPSSTSSSPPARCWTWPAGMTSHSYILNGAYQVTACGSVTGATCGSPDTAQQIRVAAPPGPPTHVQARASGYEVAVSWQPPSSAPPDLAGYTVVRNGHDVYSCSLDGLGPGASVPCPASLTVTDRPGRGRYTYAVSAVRLGADTASTDTVSSAAVAAAGGNVTVPGPGAGSGPAPSAGTRAGGAGTNGGFTPAPIIGSAGATVGLDSGAVAAPGRPGAAGTETGTPGSPANLPYPSDDPIVGQAAPLALKVHTPAGRSDVVPLAALALGILLLAIAAHLLYLRTELEARRTPPRHGGPLSG